MTSGHGERPAFGAELRRLRLAAGMSMQELSRRTGFSQGFISKVENGKKAPSADFIRRTDTALGAGGLLLSYEGEREAPRETLGDDQAAATIVLVEPARDEAVDDTAAKQSLETFAHVRENLRTLGQQLNPSVVLDMVKPHVPALQNLASRLRGPLAEEALLQAAKFAEFGSWMAQEAGDDSTALEWVADSVALANAANDKDMVANAYLRRANIAMYQQDAYGTITSAQQAFEHARSPRMQGLALLREAQGHALVGDQDKFALCMDQAAKLPWPDADAPPDTSVVGPTRIPSPIALAKGWSLFDLGRPAEAIDVLEPLLARTNKENGRAWARTAARLALALASLREMDRACALTEEILKVSIVMRSATIRSDLRMLARTLNRWNSDPAVREIAPRLSAALLPAVSGHTGRTHW